MQNGELGQTSGVASAGQRDHLIGRWVAADEIERALADRAGGAEDGNAARPHGMRLDLDGERCEGRETRVTYLYQMSSARARTRPDRGAR